jgi:hypothetical protein
MYPLIEVIVITLLAVMAFAEEWEDIGKIWKNQGKLAEKVPPPAQRYTQTRLPGIFVRLKSDAVAACFIA